MRPLAILASDLTFGADLRLTMERAGFHVDLFATSRVALPLLHDRVFSLAILDLGIRDADPFAICREASASVPVIALTARDGQGVCIGALEAGADDCICRPVVDRELVARVRNTLRRSSRNEDAEYDEIATVVSEMRVRVETEVRDLTAGETAVLAALLDHAPAPMTALEIAHTIGAKRATVESRIKSLRKKLGRERLVSRGRFGYELAAE